jgi:DNA-binding MarR family transcriptional regulator
MSLSPRVAAQAFVEAFGAVFLRFHRRGPKRSLWTPQGWAILQHLELAGPLTVTEAARHMERAQSVMSEIIGGLERKGLLARMRDTRDRRRTLVWLSDAGRAALAAERQVLDGARLERAFAKLGEEARAELLRGLGALVDASAVRQEIAGRWQDGARAARERKARAARPAQRPRRGQGGPGGLGPTGEGALPSVDLARAATVCAPWSPVPERPARTTSELLASGNSADASVVETSRPPRVRPPTQRRRST